MLILAVRVPSTGAQSAPHLEPPPAPLSPTAPAPVRERPERSRLAAWPPFFRDTRLILFPRLFFFHRDNSDRSRRTAWAVGGALAYKSGYLLDRLALGAVGYTSIGLYAPPDRDGSQLLKRGQKNIYVLGQLYAEGKIRDGVVLHLYRKDYETPYINRSDTRMLPNTFEAYTITVQSGKPQSPAGQWSWQGGYFTRIKGKDDSSFIPMSRAAGVGADRGVGLVAGRFTSETLSGEAFGYYCPDVITIIYSEARLQFPAVGPLTGSLAGQFSQQTSNDAKLLRHRPFATRQGGLQADLGYQSATLTLAWTGNAIGGSDLHSFWGTYPGFTSVQVRDFNRAGEHALLVKGTYDFSRHGLPGLKVFLRWVRGWHRVNPVTRQAVPNEDELDVDVQWQPPYARLKDLSLRLRCARVWQRGGTQRPLDDYRLIVNYRLPLL